MPPSAPGVPSAGPTTPRGIPLASLPAQSWDVWWQWNRSVFLQPPDYALDDQQHETRNELTSLLISHLKHSDAKVRLAALRALGKVAGGAATQHLLSMLDDAVQEVREDAILALGTTGSARAVHVLMHIASYGRAPGPRRQKIGRSSRPLAVIALGLARRYGVATELDAFVRNLPLDNNSTSKTKVAAHLQRDLVMAKLLYATLVGSEAMQETAHELAGGKKTTLELRSRALESLATTRNPDSLQMLMRSLAGHKLEARRSAALALGGFDSPAALEPLRRACKAEHELLTCAFLQISLGQRGGAHARKILLKNLQRGRRALRPWAAIGLGLLARQAGQKGRDETALNALRQAYRSERNRGSRGAYLLALGLARDAASVHELAHAVREAKVPADRTAAGHALALLGAEFARPVVRDHLRTDPRHIARAALAEVLGYVGEPEDAKILIGLFQKTGRADDLPQIARAIGMLPSREAYLTMLGIVRAKSMPAWFKATAIDALGMMLSKHRRFHLAELAHNANFTIFPDWTTRVFHLDL